MGKKKVKKVKTAKTDYKKKYKKLKVKYKKLKAKVKSKPKKKKKSKKNVKKVLADNSSNYNAKDAILKLRTLTNVESLNTFTKGEKRTTVLNALQGRTNRITNK